MGILKNVIAILCLFVFFNKSISAQENFRWEVVKVVEEKTKAQLYSQTKMFIAKNWNSANSVIQNDDKEGGNVIIKGVTSMKMRKLGVDYTYYYDYTMSFFFKDGKYKIIIDGVNCKDVLHSCKTCNPLCIPPFEGSDPPFKIKSFFSGGIPKDMAIAMMKKLKKELSSYIELYANYIDSANDIDDF